MRCFEQRRSELQITVAKGENMLPRTSCSRISEFDWTPVYKGADCVRDQPVFGPVAATDHIAAASGRQPHSVAKRLLVALNDHLGAGFGSAVGIVAAEFIRLHEYSAGFEITIDFIGSNRDDRPNVSEP